MRLSTDSERDEALAEQTISAALNAGITVFDTAHAYGLDEHDLGHNERLVARLLASGGASARRIITKGGMSRRGGGWVPDGRAKAIRVDCEASLNALGGLPIDLYLIHAPDPRTPWPTSVRALRGLLDEGLVRRVGLSNVNLPQLDEALELAPIAAVQIALSVHDDRAVRGGLLERCRQRGIALIAHSPLGGPRRAKSLARDQGLPELALAWLLELSPNVVAIPGARRPETARSAARAARLKLTSHDLARLERSFELSRPARAAVHSPPPGGDHAEVVMIMGIPGAGKTRLAGSYASRGYVRLNRDERGGALRGVADALEHELDAGARTVVLDNTYLTRAARSYVTEVAARHGIGVRCVWLDTPLAQAQVNMVERLLERCGALPTPEELRDLARREPGMLSPTQQMRALRELEPPTPDEGFASVQVAPFARVLEARRGGAGVFIAAAALAEQGSERVLEQHAAPDAPCLVFDWRPDGTLDELLPLAEQVRTKLDPAATVQAAVCPHGGGPPRCWCRPPLPGLPLAFARAHEVDPARSVLIGVSAAHRTLATAIGARYVAAATEPGGRRGAERR